MAGPQISLPLSNDLNLQGRTLLEANFAWNTDNNYGIGDLAHHNNQLYRALIDTPAGQVSLEPGTAEGATQWSLLEASGGGTSAVQEVEFMGTVSDILPTGTTTEYTVTFGGGPTTSSMGTTPVTNEEFTVPVRTNFINAVADPDGTTEVIELSGYGTDVDGTYTRVVPNQAALFQATSRDDSTPSFGIGIFIERANYLYDRSTNDRWLVTAIYDDNSSIAWANGSSTRTGSSSSAFHYLVIDQEPPTSSQNNFDVSSINVYGAVLGPAILTRLENGRLISVPFGDGVSITFPRSAPVHEIVVTDNTTALTSHFAYTNDVSDTEVEDRRTILQGLVAEVNADFGLTGNNAWTLSFSETGLSTIDTSQADVNRYSLTSSVNYRPDSNGSGQTLTFNETVGASSNNDVLSIAYFGANRESDNIAQLSNDPVDAGFITHNVNSINNVATFYSAAVGEDANTIVFTSAAAESAGMTFEFNAGSAVTVSVVRTRTGAVPTGPITQATLTIDGDSIPVVSGDSAEEVAIKASRYVDNSKFTGSIRAGNKAVFASVNTGSRTELPVVYTGAPNSLTFTSTFTEGS